MTTFNDAKKYLNEITHNKYIILDISDKTGGEHDKLLKGITGNKKVILYTSHKEICAMCGMLGNDVKKKKDLIDFMLFYNNNFMVFYGDITAYSRSKILSRLEMDTN